MNFEFSDSLYNEGMCIFGFIIFSNASTDYGIDLASVIHNKVYYLNISIRNTLLYVKLMCLVSQALIRIKKVEQYKNSINHQQSTLLIPSN